MATLDRPKRRPRRYPLMLLTLLLLAWLGMALYQAFKPMPEGLALSAPLRPASQVDLLIDQSFETSTGEQISQQQIFDNVLELIAQARRLVVLDMFLFNDFAGADSYRPLSSELVDALLSARERQPNMQVVVITDPFNTLYGGLQSTHLQQLKAAGVDLVITDVDRLPASNPFWSGLWHLCCQWFGNSSHGGWLPNPVGDGKVTLRTYLHLINFRANHRKTLIVDQGDDWAGLVTSANPHDASSRHSNQALRFNGAAALDLLASERAVPGIPTTITHDWPDAPQPQPLDTAADQLQILSEGAIRDSLLALVNSARQGDRLDLEVFYLSYRPLVEALIQAHQRGVVTRVLLDPNRDAFGREKNGIPNRQVAWDLSSAGITVRWCATQGEQCHRKWLRLERSDGSAELLSGSANFTRRNLDNLNLETDVRLLGSIDSPVITASREQFERTWNNAEGNRYSLPYETFADHSRSRYLLYRVMEASGLSTF